LNQNPSSSACSHGSCQARVKHAPRQYQAYVLTYARHSELSRNLPQLLTPFSHMEDPELDSENTPSRSDTPSIWSYLLKNTPNGDGGGGGGELYDRGGGRVAIQYENPQSMGTVSCTVSIQPARITQAQTASGNSQTTMPRQRGTTGNVAACTGHHPSASALGNRTT
jgi:hypothetical protein